MIPSVLLKRARIISIDSGGHRKCVLAARDALVLEHLCIVPPIADRIHRTLPPGFELEDLIGTGNWGLLRAATRYRPEQHRGTPFAAFARPRIRGAILDSIRRKNWTEAMRDRLPEDYDALDPAPADALERSIDRQRLSRRLALAITRLTIDQQLIIEALEDNPPMRLRTLACALGMSIDEIWRQHGLALAALRRELAA